MITAHDATGARIAIVTGTTRGIGAAVVERLLERGWSVVGVARHLLPRSSIALAWSSGAMATRRSPSADSVGEDGISGQPG